MAIRRLEPPIRLVIGAGSRSLPGWLNTDVTPRARYFLDATRRWPTSEGSLSHIYADNVIEHVSVEGALSMLDEAWRALVPGGRLRIATPDVEAVATVYLAKGPELEALLEIHRRNRRRAEYPVDVLNVVFHEWGHRFGHQYDYEALSSLLDRAGFGDIGRVKAGESLDPVLRDLEKRTGPMNDYQLVVEAIRPAESDETITRRRSPGTIRESRSTEASA